MAFDFKKEYKEFYMPKNRPGIITVPPVNYIAVRMLSLRLKVSGGRTVFRTLTMHIKKTSDGSPSFVCRIL